MRYLLLLCFFALTSGIKAQAPANDACADAIEVMLDITYDFTTLESTTDGPKHPSASCFGTNDSIPHDVWYTFTSPITGEVKWSNCGTADYDSRVVVYQAGIACTPGPDDFLACNDDGPAGCSAAFFTSEVSFPVTSGQTYLLRVGGYADADGIAEGTGTFIMEELVGGPDNNQCGNAIAITLGEDQAFSTIDATTDGPDHPDNPCFGFGSITATNDIWYTFTPDFTGAVQWATCNSINFDSRLAVYGPNVNCPVADEDLYTCNDDGAGCENYSSSVVFTVDEGQTYLMRIGGWNGEQGQGTFDLIEVAAPMPPANDLCDTPGEAYIITREVADNFEDVISGTTADGTFESENYIYPICLTNQNGGEFSDVWYTFNTLGNETLELRLLLANDIENSAFFMDVFAACDMMVDTSVIMGSCLNVNADIQLDTDTLTGLPLEPTQLFIRVTTRLTSDAPGDFGLQIIGDIVSGVNDLDFLKELSFFPNPVSEMAALRFNLEESNMVSTRIMNTLGQEVRSANHGQLASGQHSLEMNLHDLQPGIYLLNISNGSQQQNLKFIKQ
ncbi:MAG: hypothetical protein DHS20C18_27350 [Saprospiraceae bacterium]|nr:MAG: hypothetical protein DHS20C18_27350 [Saprospiraceae bacterium]